VVVVAIVVDICTVNARTSFCFVCLSVHSVMKETMISSACFVVYLLFFPDNFYICICLFDAGRQMQRQADEWRRTLEQRETELTTSQTSVQVGCNCLQMMSTCLRSILTFAILLL